MEIALTSKTPLLPQRSQTLRDPWTTLRTPGLDSKFTVDKDLRGT